MHLTYTFILPELEFPGLLADPEQLAEPELLAELVVSWRQVELVVSWRQEESQLSVETSEESQMVLQNAFAPQSLGLKY